MDDIPAVIASSFQRAPWGWALLATVILAVIKIWPILAQLSIEAKAKIRGERRDDLTECQRRCDELSEKIDRIEEKLHQTDLKLLGAISAYRILDAEVEATNPGATALAQARLVMSAAFTVSPSTDAGAKP